MLGQVIAHKVADFVDELAARGEAVPQDHEGLDGFSSYRVGHADSRGHYDCGVPCERIFNFRRTNAIAAAVDDIVGASLEPKVAVVVATAEIAGDQPAIGVFVASGLAGL
jgi:hypothetical protein